MGYNNFKVVQVMRVPTIMRIFFNFYDNITIITNKMKNKIFIFKLLLSLLILSHWITYIWIKKKI